MKLDICDWGNQKLGELEVADSVFGAVVRKDIMARVVRWQLAKRQAGTHKVKRRGELSYSHKKFRPQKGSGRSRQGYRGATHFRGGATVHGPVVRSHAYKLPKKVRALGLVSALSGRAAEGRLKVMADFKDLDIKTKDLAQRISAFTAKSILFIEGAVVSEALQRTSSNLARINVLPTAGANVYDVLKHEQILLSREAVEKLTERLS